MFFVLITVLVIFAAISFYLFRKDLFAPSVIVTFAFLLSCLCALYNYNRWDLGSYSAKTVFIIIISLLSFIIASLVANKVFKHFENKDKTVIKNKSNNKFIKKFEIIKNYAEKYRNNNKIIHLNKYVIILILLLFIIVICWNLYDVYRISHLVGNPKTFSRMMSLYRHAVSYSILKANQKSPIILNQLSKVITIISYIVLYIIIRNLFNKDKIKNNIMYFVFLALFMIYALTTGGRMPILKLSAAGAFLCYTFARRKANWKENISFKFIKIGVVSVIILFVVFTASKQLLGRGTNMDPLYYITMYAGGSLKLFDMYLVNPVEKSSVFGKETFYGINTFLGRFGLSNQNYIKHLEFRYTPTNLFIGNVYTPFRRYYADFGILGCILLTTILAFIINYLYLYITQFVSKRKDYKKDVLLNLYALIVYFLFLYSIDDQFYNVIISINYLTNALIMVLVYWILVYLDVNRITKAIILKCKNKLNKEK